MHIQLSNSITMTSREIAELVGSRHDKVKQSIDRLIERGVIVQPPMGDEPGTDAMDRTRTTKVYVFTGERGKRDSIVVVAQLSPEFTARLVDRWQELESAAAGGQLAGTDPRIKALADMVAAGLMSQAEAKSRAMELAGIKPTPLPRWRMDGLPHKPRVRKIVEPDAVRPAAQDYRAPRIMGGLRISQVANVPMVAAGAGKKIIGGEHFIWLALWELGYMEWDGALTPKGKIARFIIPQDGLSDPYQFWQRDLFIAMQVRDSHLAI